MLDWSLGALVEAGRIHPSWVDALTPMAAEIAAIGVRLTTEPTFLPPAEHVFRAFERPFDDVRVLIVGQDPYPTPGHSIGLAFAVDRGVKPLPRSLNNIDKELQADLGLPAAPHGDLSAWADQGVLLLNRVLTVAPWQPGSHRRWGWEQVTQQVIAALTKRSQPLVSILWGKDAEKLSFLVPADATIISAHPSPLSASRGFFGSKPFSRANQLLVAQGATPINWARDTPEQHDAVALF